jgi:hypothetical protein
MRSANRALQHGECLLSVIWFCTEQIDKEHRYRESRLVFWSGQFGTPGTSTIWRYGASPWGGTVNAVI